MNISRRDRVLGLRPSAISGEPSGDRTRDPLIKSRVAPLYSILRARHWPKLAQTGPNWLRNATMIVTEATSSRAERISNGSRCRSAGDRLIGRGTSNANRVGILDGARRGRSWAGQ